VTVFMLLISSSVFAQGALESEEGTDSREQGRASSPLGVGLGPTAPTTDVVSASEEDPETAQRLESIRRYNAIVTDIELDGGAWDNNLVEELSALGELQQQQGDHHAAIETFDRAMHVNRINSGLHTLEQIPAAEQLIQSYMALGNWEQVDIHNRYLFYLQQKNFGSDDPRFIPVLEQMAIWNMQAFKVGYGEILEVRLLEAQAMFSEAARMVAIHFGKSDARFIDYLRNAANSAYLISQKPDFVEEGAWSDFSSAQQLTMSGRQGAQLSGFRVGKGALIEIVESLKEQDSVYALAEATANLADWYLVFGQRRRARENYAQAWQILQTEENSEELEQRLFGKVVRLPALASKIETPEAFFRGGERSDGLRSGYVDLIFDVTAGGVVRNVGSVSEVAAANRAQINKLKASMRHARFRPLIVDGKLEASEGNRITYRYWY